MADQKIVSETALTAIAKEIRASINDTMLKRNVSGAICTFAPNIEQNLPSVLVNVVATGGNGTPDNPIAINGYTEANITACGVNLFDEVWEEGYINSGTGAIVWSSAYNSTDFIRVTPNTQYYCKATIISADTPNVCYYNANKEKVVYQGSVGSFFNNVFTTPNNADICYTRITITNASTSIDNFGINYPATDTTYHAYNGTTYTIAFGQTVYGGVLDVTRGKLHVTYGKDSFASKSWTQYSTGFFAFNFSDAKANANGLCEIYEVVVDKSYANAPDNSMQLRGTTVLVKDTSCADTTALIARVGSAEFIYELATPVEIDLTPVQIRAIVGSNNVFADTNGDTEVEYLDKIESITDLVTEITGTLTAGTTSITLSDASITTSSTIDVYTDTFGVNPTNIAVATGSVTLTFASQASNLGVKVRIS